jgi:hypothetical protein
MAHLSGKLTKKLIENLGAGRHGDGNGLYLVVDPSGARRWIVRVVVKGQKTRWVRRLEPTLDWVAQILSHYLTGLSHTTIRRIWNAFGLQPHRSETFKLSTDPLFADKLQDTVGLYMSLPNRAIVLCVDEKSQIQALDREHPVLPSA